MQSLINFPKNIFFNDKVKYVIPIDTNFRFDLFISENVDTLVGSCSDARVSTDRIERVKKQASDITINYILRDC